MKKYKIMVLKIEIPDNILLHKDDEIIIKFSNLEQPSCSYVQQEMKKAECVGSEDNSHRASPLHLHTFVQKLREKFITQNKVRLAETYHSAIKSFNKYRNGTDTLLKDIDGKLIEDYENYLKQNNLTLNTISFYMRILRAIYNKAVREGIIADKKPFAHVFTKNAKTAKRAISINDIKKIANAQITNKTEAMARDLFLFSFYTRGMSFIDIVFLQKTDINGAYLIYKRKKTGQELKIAWRKEMQELVDKYSSIDNLHLLGILDSNSPTSLRKQYHYKQCLINLALKRIANRLNLGVNLTMYVARHSWATIAKQKNVPLSVISDGMGHHSEKTTRIYLQSIDAEVIDRTNAKLISAISKPDKSQ